MAVAIRASFDIEPTLVEGHSGIYEISVSGQVVYTNTNTCSTGFPSHQEIVKSIGRVTGLIPKAGFQEPQDSQERTSARALPRQDEEASVGAQSSRCDCGPGDATGRATDTDCCDSDASCCGPAETAEKGVSLGRKVIAGVVIFAAVTLAGVSIAKKAGWIGGTPTAAESALAAEPSSSSAGCSAPGPQRAVLTEFLGGHEALFALLPCDHEEHTQELIDTVSPAVEKLQQRGKRTDLVILDPTSPVYADLAQTITSFPSVVIIGAECAPSVLTDDPTEAHIFSAFIAATSPSCASSCGTASSCGSEQQAEQAKAGGGCCP